MCEKRKALTRGKMFYVYVAKLVFRAAVFLTVLWAYFKAPQYWKTKEPSEVTEERSTSVSAEQLRNA